MGTAPVFASAAEALEVVRAGLRFVAAADATQLTAAERIACLHSLEKAHSAATAARTTVLGAFVAGQDYADDGDYSACSWLMHRTGITHGAAVSHTAWMKWARAHPAVHAALAAERISDSYARVICGWTSKLPEDSRSAADEILLGAAASGLELADLAGLAGEMYERSRQDKPDTDPGDDDGDGDGDPDTAGGGSEGEGGDGGDGAGRDRERVLDDRSVTLATTFGGAGFLRGALTPECAEFVQTVLDSLSAPVGAEDGRSHEQRYHDALHEAMRRLIAAGLVPERAGHCEWAGGCSQPAGACQVHHVKHLADGGPTSLTGCVLLCFFHHQVMIHQRGWTLVVNPDGTTTAWNKDKSKVLHSHGPPVRPG